MQPFRFRAPRVSDFPVGRGTNEMSGGSDFSAVHGDEGPADLNDIAVEARRFAVEEDRPGQGWIAVHFHRIRRSAINKHYLFWRRMRGACFRTLKTAQGVTMNPFAIHVGRFCLRSRQAPFRCGAPVSRVSTLVPAPGGRRRQSTSLSGQPLAQRHEDQKSPLRAGFLTIGFNLSAVGRHSGGVDLDVAFPIDDRLDLAL